MLRWVVFGVLLVGGAAILYAGRRRAGGRRRAVIAGVVVMALGVLVAISAPEADVSLAFLGGGAVVATAGVAPTRRDRADVTPGGRPG